MELIELPELISPAPRFLPPGASVAERITAAVNNHIAWFSATARAGGGVVRRENDVVFIGPGTDAGRDGVIAFPRMNAAMAGETLDRIIAFYREGRPQSGEGGSVSVWATTPTRPRDLSARLMARGFEEGWRPHWMAADLHNLHTDFPLPDNLKIAVEDEANWDVAELPYFSRDDIPQFQRIARQRPRRMWHFGAWLDGKIVGHSILFLTTGKYGVAGIYNVGVIPSARNKGVGRAVSVAACQYARALGANYALLNASTHIYDRIGFESLGHGQTWWMHDRQFSTIAQPAPTSAQIAFVEALGRGDIPSLDALPPDAFPADWDAPLLCGHTPLEIAVITRKPHAARWLENQGATLSLFDAWDFGWKARVRRTLAAHPAMVNEYSVGGVRTPLHEAAGRNDLELLALLLTANPNLTLQDKEFNGTALNWTHHFRHEAAAKLLTDHAQKNPASEEAEF